MFNNPVVKTVLTVVAVVLFLKYVAPRIPVVGGYISIT
jgi:hypothetical protein